MAVSYDLVLEDRLLARQAVRKRARPFSQEIAEMARHAVGYRSRAFVVFGPPIPLAAYDPESRRDVVRLTQTVHRQIGLLYKVLPTALVATAFERGMTRAALTVRLDELIPVLGAEGANLAVDTGQAALHDGLPRLIERGVLAEEGGRLRVRDRLTLRYYRRSLTHLLQPGRRPAH